MSAYISGSERCRLLRVVVPRMIQVMTHSCCHQNKNIYLSERFLKNTEAQQSKSLSMCEC